MTTADCPSCAIIQGRNSHIDGHLITPADVFYQNAHVTAVISLYWWPNNPGHAVIVPNQHIEMLYDMPFEIGGHIFAASREIAIAFKQVYGCEGVSIRQHNERAGNQSIFHYHMHVFPRWHNDYLYDLTWRKRATTPEERLPYVAKLRGYFEAKGA